jgi:hypothetical protein
MKTKKLSLLTRLNYFRKGLEAPNASGVQLIDEAMARIKELETAIANHRVEKMLLKDGGDNIDQALWKHSS